MSIAAPSLPDAGAVAQNLKTWAATEPALARMLLAGVPVPNALSRWSMELLRTNRAPQALIVISSALALTPGDALLWTDYAAVLNQENLPNESVACVEYSLHLMPRQPQACLLLGMVRQKLGDTKAAEAAYRLALEQEPGSIAAWQLLGLLKQEQQDYSSAIDCLNACVAAGADGAALFANLGKLCYQLGRFPQALAAYQRAATLEPLNIHYRRMARKTAFLMAAINGDSIDETTADFKKSLASEGPDAEKELLDLFQSSFSILSGFGHTKAAVRVGRKQLAMWPENPSLTYLLKAVTGDFLLDRSPAEYVTEHFDAFADGFDAQLVKELGYDIPEKICRAVRELTPAGALYHTLDAGCGTGLCGPLLRPLSRKLTGVDLSSRMLAQAARKAIYDSLSCEDLISFLNRNPDCFDLIVAADLIIYFGDLTPVFASAATCLKPGGLLALSAELSATAGFLLTPSGRFAHSPEYVRSLAAPRFESLLYIETTIRLEANARLPGNIFIFRKR